MAHVKLQFVFLNRLSSKCYNKSMGTPYIEQLHDLVIVHYIHMHVRIYYKIRGKKKKGNNKSLGVRFWKLDVPYQEYYLLYIII